MSTAVTTTSSLSYLPLAPTASPYNSITITGTYFDSVANGLAVALNSIACTSVSVTGHTSITCIPPDQTVAGAGVYNTVVTLVAPSTDTAQFTYYGAAALTSVACKTVNAVDCSAYTAAVPMSGGIVTITGTAFPSAFPAAAVVQVGGVACVSTTVVSATEITCTAPARTSGAGVAQAVTVVVAGQANTGSITLTYSECCP